MKNITIKSPSTGLKRAHGRLDAPYKTEAEANILEAFFAGRLSEDGHDRVLAWLSEELGVDVNIVRRTVDEALAAEPGQVQDADFLARLQRRLRSEILGEPAREQERTTRPVPPRRSRQAPLFLQRPVASLAAAMRLTKSVKGQARAQKTTLLLIDPLRLVSRRDLQALERFYHVVKVARNVKNALEFIVGLPKDAFIEVVCNRLSRAEKYLLREALDARRGPVSASEKHEVTDGGRL